MVDVGAMYIHGVDDEPPVNPLYAFCKKVGLELSVPQYGGNYRLMFDRWGFWRSGGGVRRAGMAWDGVGWGGMGWDGGGGGVGKVYVCALYRSLSGRNL